MAEKKSPFGLSPESVAKIDWDLAIKRILHDIKSDFIYAPHLRFIYKFASEALIAAVKADLGAGKFTPAFPINIEVPKSARMQTKFMSRAGPPYSRQGSILPPKDRLLYQAIADAAISSIRDDTDEDRSFSHRIAPDGSENPFLPTRACWNFFREAQKKTCS